MKSIALTARTPPWRKRAEAVGEEEVESPVPLSGTPSGVQALLEILRAGAEDFAEEQGADPPGVCLKRDTMRYLK